MTDSNVEAAEPRGSVRIAVLGTGSIGQRHLTLLADRPDVEAVAVPSRPERVDDLVGEGFEAFGSLASALESRLDAVLIATDSGRHANDALAAIDAGCHVLIEKPVATTAADARCVVDAAQAAGVSAHVAACLRFDPGLRWIAERVDLIGEVVLADVECLSWLPGWRPGRDHRAGYAARSGEGGVLLDLVHEFDYCDWLLGTLTVVGAILQNRGIVALPEPVEETAIMVAECGPGRSPLTMRLSYGVQMSSRNLTIIGSSGRLMWDAKERVASYQSNDEGEVDQFRWSTPEAMYSAQIDCWIAHLRGSTTCELATAADGARAVDACDQAKRFAERSGSGHSDG